MPQPPATPVNNAMSVDDLAAKIKAKYPSYSNVPNAELVDRITAKYPEYRQHLAAPTESPSVKGPIQTPANADPASARFETAMIGSMGGSTSLSDYYKGPEYMALHPLNSAELLGGAITDSMRQTIGEGAAKVAASKKAYSDATTLRQKMEAVSHLGSGYITEGTGYVPVVGPMIEQINSAYQRGDIASAAGATAGLAVMAGMEGYKESAPTPQYGAKLSPSSVVPSTHPTSTEVPSAIPSETPITQVTPAESSFAEQANKATGPTQEGIDATPKAQSPKNSLTPNPKIEEPNPMVLTDEARARIADAVSRLKVKKAAEETSAPAGGRFGPVVSSSEGITYTRDPKMGQLWAHGGNSPQPVSIPDEVSDADRNAYARSELIKQAKMTAALFGKTPPVVAPTPEIVPEPPQDTRLESLKPEQKQTAKAVEQTHQTAPPPPDVTQAVPPVLSADPYVPTLPPALQDSFKRLLKFKQQLDLAPSEEARSSINTARNLEVRRAQSILRGQLGVLTPDELYQLRDHVNDLAKKSSLDAENVRAAMAQTRSARDLASDMRAALATGGPVRTTEVAPGEFATAKPEAEYKGAGRILIHRYLGDKQRVGDLFDGLIPHEKPAKVSDEAWAGLQSKLRGQAEALDKEITRDVEVARDLHGQGSESTSFDDSEIPDKIKRLTAVVNMLGKYGVSGEVGRLSKLPVTYDEQGRIQFPGKLWTMDKQTSDAMFGFKPESNRAIPEDEKFDQLANSHEELSRLYKATSNAIDRQIGLKEVQRQKAIPTPQQTVSAGGTGALSSEELNRNEYFVKFDKAGNPTYLGKQPDAKLGDGEAVLAVNPSTKGVRVQNSNGLSDSEALSKFGERAKAVRRSDAGFIKVSGLVNTMQAIGPMMKKAGASARQWFNGDDDAPSISPRLQVIRDAQRMSMKAPEQTLSGRISMLPGNFWHAIDPAAFVSDRPNPIMDWTMKQDPRGQYFRNAKGQFSLDESPYAAVRTTVAGLHAAVPYTREIYGAIERDARKAGLHGETTDYLNLKAYNRAYQVLGEHANNLVQEVKQAKAQLPQTTDMRAKIDLEDKISANMTELRKIGEKFKNGTAVPGGYTPRSIQQDLAALEQKLGPQKWQQVQDYANRVFDVNRKALDLIADTQNGGKNGLITPEAYQTFIARGNEYIPLHRILETALTDTAAAYGKNSPLYLRQQHIINALTGSEKVNIDPWQASADAHTQAIKEFYRNKTLNVFLEAAGKDPDIGSYFKKVPLGHQAQKGFRVVGSYVDGVQQRYEVPEWLGQSLDTTSLLQGRMIAHAWLRWTTRGFKAANTLYSPLWVAHAQIPNLIGREMATGRDIEGFQGLRTAGRQFAQSVKAAWTHDDTWQEFAKTGIASNALMRSLYPEQNLTLSQLGAPGPLRNIAHPMIMIRSLADLPSDTFQHYHFTRERLAGLSPEAAAYNTMHHGPMPDYSQLGNWNGPVAALTTFVRADFQHLRGALELTTQEGSRRFLKMAALAIPTAMLANAAWNVQQKDAKGKPLYDRIPDHDKDRYFITLLGGTDANGRPRAIMVPKPDYVRFMFNPAEDVIYKGLGQYDHDVPSHQQWTQIMANAASRWIPSNPTFDVNNFRGVRGTAEEVGSATAGALGQEIAPGVRTPVEELFNKQLQYGRLTPIVTNEGVSPSLQGYGQKNVSPAAMWAGQETNISPQRIEHVGQGFFGSGARLVERGLNPLAERHLQLPQSPMQGEIGSGMMFTSQSEINADNRFYDATTRLQQPWHSFEMLKSINPKAAISYYQMHSEDIAKGQMASEMQAKMKGVNAAIHKIEQDPNLTDAQRQQYLQNLHSIKQDAMKWFNQMLYPNPATKPGVGATGMQSR